MYMNASYHTSFIVYVYLIADIIQYDVLYILCCISLCIVESVERQSNTLLHPNGVPSQSLGSAP